MKKKFTQNTIALVYDFDSTLTPLAMQEYTVLPKLGIKGEKFWKAARLEAKKKNSDPMLTWMRMLFDELESRGQHIGKKEFKELASQISYYQGVETWFDRINKYVNKNGAKSIKIEHYLISAGLKEIVEGCSIKKHFKEIYASEYFYDHHQRPYFPAILVNDTMKTQFLFRINKGKQKLTESINTHMPEQDRPIPFSNMIYIGDGLSDVPSMSLIKKNGGYAVAVHKPNSSKANKICKELFSANRINFFAPADYRSKSKLEIYITSLLDVIIADMKIQIEHHKLSQT